MEPKSMIVITQNNILTHEEALELLLNYTHYFIRDCYSKLENHRRATGTKEDFKTAAIQREIDRAEGLVRDFDRLRQELQTIYRWNFVKLAEVLRQTRTNLELDRIDDLYSLKVLMKNLTGMLKKENRQFSHDIFNNYINEGR